MTILLYSLTPLHRSFVPYCMHPALYLTQVRCRYCSILDVCFRVFLQVDFDVSVGTSALDSVSETYSNFPAMCCVLVFFLSQSEAKYSLPDSSRKSGHRRSNTPHLWGHPVSYLSYAEITLGRSVWQKAIC